MLIVALLTVACEDEDKFSTGAGMRLDFEVDTLKLDTVFSNTPSSTYKFWVYNRQDNGLRLQTVRLKKGNQTGFRVNVEVSISITRTARRSAMWISEGKTVCWCSWN